MKRLSAEEFLDVLRAEFDEELDPSAIIPSATLINDLGLDSIELIRLAAVIESLTGIPLPDDLDPGDSTVADTYALYLMLGGWS